MEQILASLDHIPLLILKKAMEFLQTHPISEYPNASSWNAAIGDEQLEWFRSRLLEAKKQNQRVVVFDHYPLLGDAALPSHLLWNSDKVCDIMHSPEFSGIVVAYMCGHYHYGGYTINGGIHHVTIHGILEAPLDGNCFATVDVYNDRLELRGVGTIPSRTLNFPK